MGAEYPFLFIQGEKHCRFHKKEFVRLDYSKIILFFIFSFLLFVVCCFSNFWPIYPFCI